jgi:transposase
VDHNQERNEALFQRLIETYKQRTPLATQAEYRRDHLQRSLHQVLVDCRQQVALLLDLNSQQRRR